MNTNSYSEEYKQRVYKNWIERGKPWFNLDSSKDPSYEEKQIILEMKKRENTKSKRDIELEKSTADIRERYGKKGMISDKILSHKIFDSMDNY